ncbi:MAG: chemotaxis protein CheA [Phycisphaerae bacterium]
MSEDLSKYKDTFLSEAKEHISSMEKSLLKLEKKPTKTEFLSEIFREAHTLKSMAATMDYNNMTKLCHAIEDVLDAIKTKKITTDKCIDVLFECFDTLELSLKEITADAEELDTDALVHKLQTLITQKEATTDYVDKSATSAAAKVESIEVKVERLDLLMNLAEELLINRMRLDSVKEQLQNPELSAAVDTLGRLVSDLQYNVMQSRLIPIGFVFSRFPRMVRDLAKQQKKEISLEMQGSDIELDRAVIDEIGESLVHLLRNAVDHGIETPEVRKKAGKPAQGTIRVIAKRTKSFAIIEVSDDGLGLDLEDIKRTAVKNQILSPQATTEELMQSIFFGVSTTKTVTAVSGRGFGLNIVKKKIESLGGSVKVESEPKKGTTFIIEIPLTLAIIKALFIEAGSRTYAIPLASIERLVTVDREHIKGMLNYEAIVLNEQDIPITRLDTLFNVPALGLQRQPIAIVKKGAEQLGLAVDSFTTTQEIVVKPLNKLIRENKYFSGSTIIGSGEVVLILDVANLMLTKRQIVNSKQYLTDGNPQPTPKYQ